jgi:hypothetical protein
MLLYGTSLYLPNQLRALYTTSPIGIAAGFAAFNGTILVGHFFWGYFMTATKSVRLPLLLASSLLTLFCGLASLAKPGNQAYFEGMLAAIGFLTSATQVIPTAGVGIVVPHHLIATGNTVLATSRALGGALGIAIFTAVYNAKTLVTIPANVMPILNAAGIPEDVASTIITVVSNAPQMLAKIPGLSQELITAVAEAAAEGAAAGFKDVWFCFMAASAACLLLSFFLEDHKDMMNDHVESELESGKTRLGEKGVRV